MSRLIDADELMKNIDEQLASHDGLDMFDKETVYFIGVNDVTSYIVTAPTVDAVEVVRCRECVHWDAIERDGFYYFEHCSLTGLDMIYDDFCSMGERYAE